MTVSNEKRLRLPLSWSFIEGVRSTVGEQLSSAPADLRDAAVMVASELSENVVKYGVPRDDMDCGYFSITVEPKRIVMRTVNGVTNAQRAEDVQRRVAEISASDNVAVLYTKRMRELLDSVDDQGSNLGLLRIAYEGEFNLSCSYEASLLTIEAERELP